MGEARYALHKLVLPCAHNLDHSNKYSFHHSRYTKQSLDRKIYIYSSTHQEVNTVHQKWYWDHRWSLDKMHDC